MSLPEKSFSTVPYDLIVVTPFQVIFHKFRFEQESKAKDTETTNHFTMADIENKEETTTTCVDTCKFSQDGWTQWREGDSWTWFYNYKATKSINGFYSIRSVNALCSYMGVNTMFAFFTVNGFFAIMACNCFFSILSIVSKIDRNKECLRFLYFID